MLAGRAPDTEPGGLGAGLGLSIARIGAVASIDGGLTGLDQGQVERLAARRVDDLGDLAPIAVRYRGP